MTSRNERQTGTASGLFALALAVFFAVVPAVALVNRTWLPVWIGLGALAALLCALLGWLTISQYRRDQQDRAAEKLDTQEARRRALARERRYGER